MGEKRDYRRTVITNPGISEDVTGGNVYTCGVTRNVAAGTDEHFVIENPAGSGKTIVILGFFVRTSLSADVLPITFIEDPTIVGATALTPINHNFLSANTASATVEVGTAVATGGTVLDAGIIVTLNLGYSYAGPPFILPEGKTLAIEADMPLGVGSPEVAFNVTWKEA